MRFADPIYFILFLPLALLILWEMFKKRGAVSFSDLSYLRKISRGGRFLSSIPQICLFVSLGLSIFGLARPQKGRMFEEIETRGVDIILCLDISGTMQAEDFSPKNRLYVAKERAKEFVARRTGDRIGLVVFAGQAFTQCPLTLDHKILTDLIDRVDLGLIPDGTAIGMGLATAVARLKDSKAKERIVVLLTDGLNNAGEIDPITAAKIGQSYKIKVYSIGVGSKGLVPYPVFHPIFGKRYVQTEIDFDMNTLREISALTGGKAFLATDGEGLKKIYEEIDRLEPTTFKVSRHTVYSEKADKFIFPAFVFFLTGILLSTTILRRIP